MKFLSGKRSRNAISQTILLLLYAMSTAYFEPASIFPVAMEWLGYLGILFLLLLGLLILFPTIQKTKGTGTVH